VSAFLLPFDFQRSAVQNLLKQHSLGLPFSVIFVKWRLTILNALRKLAGQTAVYGLSTIVGRLLNYALVPFYTYIFGAPADFGTNTEFYAYISFFNIIFTYGMETALFHFSAHTPDKERVYSTALRSLLISTAVLTLPFLFFADSIASTLRYPGHSDFVVWAILIIATDAIAAIPFAKLREENKAARFAGIKFLNILVNLSLNFFFIGYCKHAYENNPGSFAAGIYDPDIGIGYAFLANLIANAITLVLLSKELGRVRGVFDSALFKKMLRYALPLLIVGLAGMANETLDRILLKYLLPEGIGETQVGIYGACYKISILMTIFIQAFRYAAEPFFFAKQKEDNAREMYADVMLWFVLFCLVIFLGTTVNLSWIQYFVGEAYRVGLGVVPILMLANLFLGMYFNLSIWYKLTGRTQFGMWLTTAGAIITITLNTWWIPMQNDWIGGYMGSAWATLLCYGSMMVASYFIGQKYYPVAYPVSKILFYIILAVLLYMVYHIIAPDSFLLNLITGNIMLVVFLGVLWIREKPLQLLARSRASKSPNP
jgi:O-antigen/teichoic acid export membrane protein